MPSSKNCEPGSTNCFTRSRPVRRPFLCWESTALGPPPTQICSSSFLSWVSKSMMRRWFFWAAADLASTVLFKTEAGTQDLGVFVEDLKMRVRNDAPVYEFFWSRRQRGWFQLKLATLTATGRAVDG